MKKNIFILIVLSIIISSCGSSGDNSNVAKTSDSTKVIKAVFDIPALVGLNIDEIKKILGKPTKDDEPTKLQLRNGDVEWDKEFTKDGYTVLVTYDAKTRNVIDLFIPTKDPSGKTKDYSDLLKIGNLVETDEHYTIKPVSTAIDNESYTGIKIIKK